MKRFVRSLTFGALSLCALASSHIYAAIEMQDAFEIETDPVNGLFQLSWAGRLDNTYFIQHTTELSHNIQWDYAPIMEVGDGSDIFFGGTSNTTKAFFRFVRIDDPYVDDFDSDNVDNWNELLQATDPLSWSDDNNNLLPEDWELFYGVTDPAADADTDSYTNLLEFQYGTNPNDKTSIPFALTVNSGNGFGLSVRPLTNSTGDAPLGLGSSIALGAFLDKTDAEITALLQQGDLAAVKAAFTAYNNPVYVGDGQGGEVGLWSVGEFAKPGYANLVGKNIYILVEDVNNPNALLLTKSDQVFPSLPGDWLSLIFVQKFVSLPEDPAANGYTILWGGTVNFIADGEDITSYVLQDVGTTTAVSSVDQAVVDHWDGYIAEFRALMTPYVPPVAPDADANAPNESLLVWYGENDNEYELKWWGHPGRAYYVQTSTNLRDVSNMGFSWHPMTEDIVGAGDELAFDIQNADDIAFFRLVHSGDMPYSTDFDSDHISNIDELGQSSHPFDASSNDSDLIPDDWENFYYNTTQFTPASNTDGDLYTMQEEFDLYLNPTLRNSTSGPVVNLIAAEQDNEVYVSFANPYPEGTIHYTTDGSAPDANSPSFEIFDVLPNQTDASIKFDAYDENYALPGAFNGWDFGSTVSIKTLPLETGYEFGWQSELEPNDFGAETLKDVNNIDRDFSYVFVPRNNEWSFTLERARYTVELQIVNATGNQFEFNIEGQKYTDSALVPLDVSPEIPGVYTLTTTVDIEDGALNIDMSKNDIIKVDYIKVVFDTALPSSTGSPPYNSGNLLLVRDTEQSVKAVVAFRDGTLSEITTEEIDLADGLGVSSEIYYGVTSVLGQANWGLGNDTASFVAGYGYMSLGRGWIAADGSFIFDPAYPQSDAYIASVDFGNVSGAHSKIECFTYNNASLQSAVSNGRAILIPLGERRITGISTLAPISDSTPSTTVYYGNRPTKLTLNPQPTHSTDPAVFTNGQYVALGTGWVTANEASSSGIIAAEFTPDTASTSQDIYIGTTAWGSSSLLYLSTDSSKLVASKRVRLGKGWPIKANDKDIINGEFIPDLSSPSEQLYLGKIENGFTDFYLLAAGTQNMSPSLPVGKGWISEYFRHYYEIIPDTNSPSQALYVSELSGMNASTLTTQSSGSFGSFGLGWAKNNREFEADLVNQTDQPIYYGWVPELSRTIHSYTRASMVGNGARVTSGKITSETSMQSAGQSETVYYAPIPLVNTTSGGYSFIYSNENTASALEMGVGVIQTCDKVAMDMQQPASMLYYGVFADVNGAYKAYSKSTSGFLNNRFVEVGDGRIVSQKEDYGFKVIMDSPIVTDTWFGSVSSSSQDASNTVFRSSNSFSTLPAAPVDASSYYYTEGGVTYYYAGRGKILDAQNFEPDSNLLSASLYSGYTQQPPTRYVITAEQASVNASSYLDDGWTYGEESSMQLLAAPEAGSFTHAKSPASDVDFDGLTAEEEILVHGTNPLVGDTDGDLVPDALEIELGRDPLGYDDPYADDDNDGLANYLELLNGTDPSDPDGDTDNDGYSDLVEIEIGSSPTNANDTPDNTDLDNLVEMKFTIGDWSGSKSERFRVEVTEVDSNNSESFVYRLSATTHGEVVDGKSKQFRVGKHYRVRVFWEGTKLESPDMDWILEISGTLPIHRISSAGKNTIAANQPLINSNAFGIILDDNDIMGQHDSGEFGQPSTFPHSGKVIDIYLLEPQMGVDANRDGIISLADSADQTTESNPYMFWINDDTDDEVDKELEPVTPDYSNDTIDNIRDLEDFTRLWVSCNSINDELISGKIELGFKWLGYTGTPSLKMYYSENEDGNRDYLKHEYLAVEQVTGIYDTAVATVNSQLGAPAFLNNALLSTQLARSPDIHFIFEGARIGEGKLTMVLRVNGEEIEGPQVSMNLLNIKKLYHRGKATPETASEIDNPYLFDGLQGYTLPTMSYVEDNGLYSLETQPDEEQKYVVYIHGWSQSYEAYLRDTETFYKRLWHSGYKGRVASFRWPTYALEDYEDEAFGQAQLKLTSYNPSDFRAWLSGSSLKAFVESLPQNFDVHIAAHSMGNVVAASALREGLVVDKYAAMNAALPAMCYDGTIEHLNPADTEDDNTPDTAPDSATQALGFKNQVPTGNAIIINYYLENDSALNTPWEANNYLFKPHHFPDRNYDYRPNEPSGEKVALLFLTRFGRFIDEPFESMAFATVSRSHALGKTNGVGRTVNVETDLKDFGFDVARDTHGAQFQEPIQRTFEFYEIFKLEVTE